MEGAFEFFEYDGRPFKYDRKTLKVFAIGPGGTPRHISDPDRASTIFANSRTISEKEALALAEVEPIISPPSQAQRHF